MGKTNAFSGCGGLIKIGSSVVAEVREWNGTFNHETEDVTTLGSSCWVERIATRRDFTGSFDANLLTGVTMLTTGKARDAIFYLGSSDSVSTSRPKLSMRIIHSTDITVPSGAVTFSYTFESDGPVAVATA